MKIDVQGAELDIFKSAPKTMANATVVHTEVEFIELYEGQPMFADVDKHMRSIGFQFHTMAGVGTRCFKPVLANNNPSIGLKQYIWGDAIYVRDFMKLDVLGKDKLLKMAAVIHDIYQSFDLCYHILAEYDRKSGKELAPDYLNRLQS